MSKEIIMKLYQMWVDSKEYLQRTKAYLEKI